MKEASLPTAQQFRAELSRERHKTEFNKTLRGTVYILLVVAAIAVLIATLCLPVLQVTGTSMEPAFETGQIVVAVKYSSFKQGQIVAFYYNNKVLLKRVIGNAGDQITVKKDGTVVVNGKELSEPYLTEKSYGQCDISYPYQVPDGKIFVMGDHRATSEDSRVSAIGCIPKENIIGRVAFRIWPMNRFGKIE